jgi:hypothetical protein
MTLSTTPWMLLAGLGSALLGMVHVILRGHRTGGGGIQTLIHAVRDRKTAVWTIVAVDFAAGLAVAALMIFAGVSEPQVLINYVALHPSTGWLIIGAVGPLISDRLFSGSVTRDRVAAPSTGFDGGESDATIQSEMAQLKAHAWRLRGEAMHEIELRVWVLVQRALRAEAMRLRRSAQSILEADIEQAYELVRITRGLVSSHRHDVPEAVRVAVARFDDPISDESRVSLLDALINELVNSQTWYPLEVLVGDAPRPPSRSRTTCRLGAAG